jgi:glycosyltransferase involved in cell wall biosynthesis
MNPKVSICIPSYNHARFLPTAIESALAQTYRNIEIIIVDDGSSDGSLEIAQSYAERFPELISVYTHADHSNRGISATINRAFEESTGEYWSLLASDDAFYPHKTAKQVSFLLEHQDVGWVYAQAHIMDESGNLLPEVNRVDISRDVSPVQSLIVCNQITAITVFCRRACVERLGPHNEDLVYSDWEFWVRMAAHYKLGFIASPLVKYRVHSYNTSLAIPIKEHEERKLDVLNSLRRNIKTYGGDLSKPESQALIELRRAHLLFYLGYKSKAAESLRLTFELWPLIQQQPEPLNRWLTVTYESPSFYEWMIEYLPEGLEEPFRKDLTKVLTGLVFARSAMEHYQAGDLRKARTLALSAQRTDRRWICDRPLVSLLTESVVGSTAMNLARQLKKPANQG